MKGFFRVAQRHSKRRFLTLSGICLLFFSIAPESAFVCDSSGSSVDGSFRILSQDHSDRYIEFHATRSLDGQVSGQTIFRDETAHSPTAAEPQSKKLKRFSSKQT